MKLQKRLFVVKNTIGGVVRDKENPFAKAKYASLTAIQHAVLPVLEEQEIKMDIEFTVNPDMPEFYRARLVFTDMSEESFGEKEEYNYDIPLDSTQKNPVQGFGSTTTYGQRYVLAVYFNIPLEDADPDSGKTSGDNCKKKEPTKWLNPNTKDWDNTIAKVKSGEVSLSEVYKHYAISKENKEKLMEAIG